MMLQNIVAKSPLLCSVICNGVHGRR